MSDQRDRHVRRLGPAVEAADRLLVPTSISYSLLDRAVGLPPGGAQQGRLFAVVVRGRGVPGTSIERGDRLVVAPETELASGGLLVCRRMSALEVCAARVDAFGQPSLTSPDPELLPWPSVFAPVLGSVVAALRRVGRELLVAYPPRYRFERSVPPELSWRLSPTQLEQLRAEALEVERNADAARMVHPEEARVLRSCAVRLNTLSNCLEVIEDERLYGAVVEQIDSTLMRLKRILAGRPRWALLQRQLKELRPQHFAARR